eukprot:8936678-Ditylum_brightwellii.AAC.2
MHWTPDDLDGLSDGMTRSNVHWTPHNLDGLSDGRIRSNVYWTVYRTGQNSDGRKQSTQPAGQNSGEEDSNYIEENSSLTRSQMQNRKYNGCENKRRHCYVQGEKI